MASKALGWRPFALRIAHAGRSSRLQQTRTLHRSGHALA
jgi:hypothetical protein